MIGSAVLGWTCLFGFSCFFTRKPSLSYLVSKLFQTASKQVWPVEKAWLDRFGSFRTNDQPWHSLNTIIKWRVSHVLSKLTCGADVLLERVDVTSSRSLFWLAIFDLELGWTVVGGGGGGGGGGERREDPPLPFSSLWPSLTFWVQFSFSTQLSATV